MAIARRFVLTNASRAIDNRRPTAEHVRSNKVRLYQVRRHGFESGGQILPAKRALNFFDLPLFGQWETKYYLDIAKSA